MDEGIMANTPHHAGEQSTAEAGTMDISEHMKTWLGFWAGVKWGSVALIVLAILLAIFRTHN
jgi:hypothetical protein